MEDESLISVVDAGTTRHLFFNGPIDKSSTFNLNASLYSIKADMLAKYTPTSFRGFTIEEENTETGSNIPDEDLRIILHLSCPGGTINGAFLIADTIQNLGINVSCIAEGVVASAGVIILLACEDRYMLPHAQIYLHETIHSADSLSHSDIKRFTMDASIINNQMKQFYSDRTGLTIKQLNKMFNNEVILDFNDAIKYGFINNTSVVNTH